VGVLGLGLTVVVVVVVVVVVGSATGGGVSVVAGSFAAEAGVAAPSVTAPGASGS
jgi:hypothetical protein